MPADRPLVLIVSVMSQLTYERLLHNLPSFPRKRESIFTARREHCYSDLAIATLPSLAKGSYDKWFCRESIFS